MNQIAPLCETITTSGNDPASPAANGPAPVPLRHRLQKKLPFASRAAASAMPSVAGHPARGWWLGARDYEWLLALRFALANAFALALLAAAWAVGYVDTIWAADTSRLSLVIAAVFALGWLFGCRAAATISRDLNRVRRRDDRFPREPADNLKERLAGRIGIVRHTANALVFLGLIGTVIGFIVALSGVKPGEAGDVAAIAPMVATMIHGMSIALYTTLVGSVLALWLIVLHRILATAASKLLCAARAAGYA